ncbi:MAG TPA: YbaK/EbsC family protein [Anaerolineaceae bacterium]|jgi:prolyl-tRNA editing enzyme YbaK/EbsC (Cys-tRNA(Pro) deacylase)
MGSKLSPSAQRVQTALDLKSGDHQVVEYAQTTRTSKEAAQAIGCTVAQIAKSLVFRGKSTGRPVLVIASGTNRVNETTLAHMVGEPVDRPDADYVLEQTGFVIGGVPPLGHAQSIRTFIDEDLLQYPEIWAAAGSPNAVFRLTPADLQAMTGGEVVSIG